VQTQVPGFAPFPGLPQPGLADPLEGLAEPLAAAVQRFAEQVAGEKLERVAVVTEAGDLEELENIHPEAAKRFRVEPAAWLGATERASLVVHSHVSPDRLSWTPSPQDQRTQIAQCLPWAIVPPDGEAFVFGLDRPDRPLEGRGFRFGVDDCWQLFRDAWSRWAGEPLPNFARRWRWWLDGEPLIERGLHTAKFYAVPTDEMQRGDGVLFKVGGEVWNHIGFINAPGEMLHHPGPVHPYDSSMISLVSEMERLLEGPHQIMRHEAHR